ncbi:uncharacterized protein LOC124276047 [Haliotis rubra]|uniref:uncharacterized protein LOC124276047 n=1 Tax=Haliotis rubra TaxID=36100 RepID=UPI001EE4FF2A|nr:uncharacterized protein LOC124276047 [Haliotis rubra]
MARIEIGFTFLMLAVVSQASETCLKSISGRPSSGVSTYLHCPSQCCDGQATRYCCRKESFPVAGIAGIAIATGVVIFIVSCAVRHWRKSKRTQEQRSDSTLFTVQTTPTGPSPAEYTGPPSYDECVSKTPPPPPPYNSVVDAVSDRGC